MNINQVPNNNTAVDPVLQGVKDRNESYLSTIYALHAFIYVSKKCCGDQSEQVSASIGRRMNYVSDPKKKPCTPDLIVQLNNTEGIIGEAKLQICENIDDRWDAYLDQIKKYDTEMIGWWTNNERLNHQTIVLITELTFSAPLEVYIKEKINNSFFNLNRSFALIEFDKRQRSIEYLFLRIKFGLISNNSLNNELQNGIDTPFERLVVETKEKKFYDAKPQDIEYTMVFLWQNRFNKQIHEPEDPSVKFIPELKRWEISVNIDELTKFAQKTAGSVGSQNREAEYPQISLIKEALETFIKIGLAKKESGNKEYVVFFKKFRNPLEKFVYLHRKKKTLKHQTSQQMELFEGDDISA